MTAEALALPPGLEEGGALAGRLFGSMLATMELATVQLGLELGLYAALTTPRTAGDLATATGTDARYAREWLEQQAICGLVEVAEDGDADTRRYVLSAGQQLVLLDVDSPVHAAPVALLLGGISSSLALLPEAYRAGTGVSFAAYGDEVRIGQGMFNRGAYQGQLAQEWIPAMPGVAGLLSRQGAAALDLGCGVGFASLALAEAFPGLQVRGVDSDDASIMDARANAAGAGAGDRVRFEVGDAAGDLGEAAYDVVFVLEALHDMAHPVEALTAVRRALRPGGLVVVMDEAAAEEFAPDGSEVERLLASVSVLHCLPVGRVEHGSAATGALLRPATLRRYAAEAGYTAEVLPIEHDMFRFYLLTP